MTTKKELLGQLAEAEARIARLEARDKEALTGPSAAVALIVRHLHREGLGEQEKFVVALLDARRKPLKVLTTSLGTVDGVAVHPRDIFREAIRISAHSIVLGHNHPSGNSEPSESDLTLTARLVSAGKLVGIPVLDHIVVASRLNYVSFAERGLM